MVYITEVLFNTEEEQKAFERFLQSKPSVKESIKNAISLVSPVVEEVI